MTDPIASPANPRFKRIKALIQSSRERHREGASVLEGAHLVDSWLRHRDRDRDAAIELVVARRGLGSAEVTGLVGRVGVAPLVLQDRLFDSLGTMPSPAPLLAVVPTPQPVLPAAIDADTVVLDRIQDPGNVGAILRSAAAAGIVRIVTTPQTAWCWSPKVLRAAMGGHFGLTIHESCAWTEIAGRLRRPLAGAIAHGGDSLYERDLTPPCVWVFGNEGEGLDGAIDERLDWRLTIPQTRGVESLNVAAAAAICLFEQRRQRLAGASAGRLLPTPAPAG